LDELRPCLFHEISWYQNMFLLSGGKNLRGCINRVFIERVLYRLLQPLWG
jgi:hypothetical protein